MLEHCHFLGPPHYCGSACVFFALNCAKVALNSIIHPCHHLRISNIKWDSVCHWEHQIGNTINRNIIQTHTANTLPYELLCEHIVSHIADRMWPCPYVNTIILWTHCTRNGQAVNVMLGNEHVNHNLKHQTVSTQRCECEHPIYWEHQLMWTRHLASLHFLQVYQDSAATRVNICPSHFMAVPTCWWNDCLQISPHLIGSSVTDNEHCVALSICHVTDVLYELALLLWESSCGNCYSIRNQASSVRLTPSCIEDEIPTRVVVYGILSLEGTL